MKRSGYIIRLQRNIPCCSVWIQRVKSICHYKQVHVSGFSELGPTVFKQRNSMSTPFACDRNTNIYVLILLPAPLMVRNYAELLERVSFKNYHTVSELAI
jgi:hypothetical protein